MNVRMDEEGVRFRITPEDLEILLRGEEIRHQIVDFYCAILPREEGGLSLNAASRGLALCVPILDLERLRDMGRSKNGVSVCQDGIEISLQVDLKSQVQRVA